MIRVSYRRAENRDDGDRWIGVLQVNGVLLVACGHEHHNRDMSTRAGGEAAQVCARMILEGARNPNIAASRAKQLAARWMGLAGGTGWTYSAGMLTQAREQSENNAFAYLALVAEVRAHPELNVTEPPKPPEPVTERVIGDMPDWML
jgi:hypothetical protein